MMALSALMNARYARQATLCVSLPLLMHGPSEPRPNYDVKGGVGVRARRPGRLSIRGALQRRVSGPGASCRRRRRKRLRVFRSAVLWSRARHRSRGARRGGLGEPATVWAAVLQLFDLITIHELGHAFEVLGDLRLPTFWLGEIFANLALHAFVATVKPTSLPTLEVLPTVGAQNRSLDARMRSQGYHTLEELEAHYTGGDQPMSPLNYVWYQYRWQRLAAEMFDADGEEVLVRLWDCFHANDRFGPADGTVDSLVQVLRTEVSEILGRAIQDWR